MKLTTSQRRAIEHGEGNIQLIACAGSGKTEVVARRVVHLLRPGAGHELAPRNIVAFTFTEKAAAELKERIIRRCREELGEVTGLAEMFVGTIHAFCLELLKSEVPKYLKYEVLNEVQQFLLVDRNSKKSGLTASKDLKGLALRRYVDTKRYLGAISILMEADLDEKALAGCSLLDGLESYEALLDDKSYLDYSTILKAAVEVLTNEEDLRKRLRERIRYVIVDEYQDVNPVQEAIVWLLHDLGGKTEAFKTLLPLHSLRAAAGRFGDGEAVEPEGWVATTTVGRLDDRMFVARAVGRSMEPTIHDGDYLVFRAKPAGTRQGKVVLAQYRGPADSETGGAFTVKRYASEKQSAEDREWRHTRITLSPTNREFPPIVIPPEAAEDFKIVAEFVAVLS